MGDQAERIHAALLRFKAKQDVGVSGQVKTWEPKEAAPRVVVNEQNLAALSLSGVDLPRKEPLSHHPGRLAVPARLGTGPATTSRRSRFNSDFSSHERIARPALNSPSSGSQRHTSVIIKSSPKSSLSRLPTSKSAFNLILTPSDDKSTNLAVKTASSFWNAVIITGSLGPRRDSDRCFMALFCNSCLVESIDLAG